MLKISILQSATEAWNVPADFIRRCYSCLILQISHNVISIVDSQIIKILHMAIVNLRLMSINDFIDFQCRVCLFMECMDYEPCISCLQVMREDYCHQLKIRSISRLYHEICNC